MPVEDAQKESYYSKRDLSFAQRDLLFVVFLQCVRAWRGVCCQMVSQRHQLQRVLSRASRRRSTAAWQAWEAAAGERKARRFAAVIAKNHFIEECHFLIGSDSTPAQGW
jgi:hypothetical protein